MKHQSIAEDSNTTVQRKGQDQSQHQETMEGYTAAGRQLDDFATFITSALTAGAVLALTYHPSAVIIKYTVVLGLLVLLVHYVSFMTAYVTWVKSYNIERARTERGRQRSEQRYRLFGELTMWINRFVKVAICVLFISSILIVLRYY